MRVSSGIVSGMMVSVLLTFSGRWLQAGEQGPSSAPPIKVIPLSIGDPAPMLHVREWINGAPLKGLQKGKVYLLDFWSTWCVPCLAAMPHSTSLQKELGDRGLVVVGISSTDEYGNSTEAIRSMVRTKGERIGFTIGIDEEGPRDEAYQGVFRGPTVRAYLEGARIAAIPAAFVIDREGRIAFIGHPQEVDEAVKACLSGTWDLPAAKARHEARVEAQRGLVSLEAAVKKRDDATVFAIGRRLVEAVPHEDPRIFMAVAHYLNERSLVKKDPQLAIKAARRATELTRRADPGMMSTLAAVCFANGDLDQAVEASTRAVSLAEGGMKPVLEAQLEKYESARRKLQPR